MLSFRTATEDDVDIYYSWANDNVARNNSYNNKIISYPEHIDWFLKRVNSSDHFFYVFWAGEKEVPVGQIRIDRISEKHEGIISIIIGQDFRGKGYSSEMLKMASSDFIDKNQGFRIIAYVFETNIVSYKSFLKAGYTLLEKSTINNIPSFVLYAD